jgi:hypothetical protein
MYRLSIKNACKAVFIIVYRDVPMNTTMTPQLETKLRRVERASVLLRGICTALLAVVAILAIVAAVNAVTGRLTRVSFNGQSIALADLTSRARIVVTVVALLTGAVIAKALLNLRRLLDNYSRREVFTADSAGQIRQFGISCILWGAIKTLWAFLPMMVLADPPASAGVTVDAVVIGMVIVAISWFAEMATTLREENDLTI